MNIKTPTTEAEAEALRHWRDRFQASADLVRDNPAPFDVDPDLWTIQAKAWEAIVEEMDAALSAFAITCPETK
jgi:hypothetical protein